MISKVPSLTYLDDRAIEVDEKKEANIMFTKSAKYPSNHTGLKAAFGDFSHNMSAIEAATNLNSTDDDSLGYTTIIFNYNPRLAFKKLKSYFSEHQAIFQSWKTKISFLRALFMHDFIFYSSHKIRQFFEDTVLRRLR